MLSPFPNESIVSEYQLTGRLPARQSAAEQSAGPLNVLERAAVGRLDISEQCSAGGGEVGGGGIHLVTPSLGHIGTLGHSSASMEKKLK